MTLIITLKLKKVVDPIPPALDGLLEEQKRITAERDTLLGHQVGRAEALAEQAIKDAATVAALASVATPAAPVPHVVDANGGAIQPPVAPVPVIVLPNPEGLPIPVVHQNTQGEAGDPPVSIQELRRGREEE